MYLKMSPGIFSKLHAVLFALCLSLVTASMWNSSASAQGLVRGSFGYGLDEISQSNTTDKTTRMYIDFMGGYKFTETWAILAKYAMEKVTIVNSPGATINGNRTSYGAGIGWSSADQVGMYAEAIYYLNSEYDVGGTTYKGWGYHVGTGLKVNLSSVFLMAGFGYDGFVYGSTQSGSLSPKRKEAHLAPRIGIQVEF